LNYLDKRFYYLAKIKNYLAKINFYFGKKINYFGKIILSPPLKYPVSAAEHTNLNPCDYPFQRLRFNVPPLLFPSNGCTECRIPRD